MKYKAIVFDVDGTLVPQSENIIRKEVLEALKKAQRQGLKVVIATGRSYFALDKNLLGGFRADYYICANGAQIVDSRGRTIAAQTMSEQEMYALVDYFEDFDYPLAFCFSDGYYTYVEHEGMHRAFGYDPVKTKYLKDGEDQDRHLESMPFGAFGILPTEAEKGFVERYGYLELRMVAYEPGFYDIILPGINKAVGLSKLMEKTGWKAQELASAGDNDNDLEMLALTGLSYAMANGSEAARKTAKFLAPSVEENGACWVIQQVLDQQTAPDIE